MLKAEQLERYAVITFSPIKNVTIRNRVIRKLFGRKEGGLEKGGLVKKIGGKILSPTVIFVPFSRLSEIIGVLENDKVDYKIHEVWSDK